MFTTTYPLSFESEPDTCQARTIMGKLTQDWKFIAQLLAIAFMCGTLYQINQTIQHKVGVLETSDADKTRSILLIEERFEILKRDNIELKTMIQKLHERLEAKKIVNSVGMLQFNMAGEWMLESNQWQP